MHTTQCEKNMTEFKSDNCLPKIYLKKVGKIIITIIETGHLQADQCTVKRQGKPNFNTPPSRHNKCAGCKGFIS